MDWILLGSISKGMVAPDSKNIGKYKIMASSEAVCKCQLKNA